MFAKDHRLHLRGRALEIHGQQAPESERVEERSQADHPSLWQAQLPVGQEGENVDRIAHHQHDRVGAVAGRFDRGEDGAEEFHVAIDQRQPAFIRLAPQTRRDADQIGVDQVGVAAGMNRLIGDRGRAVQHIERLSVSQLGIGIDQHDLVDNATELEGKARRGSDDAAAADDSDLHLLQTPVE